MHASVTDLAKTPAWSREDEYAIMPNLEHRPYDGLNPTIPQNEAGCLTDPPVSDPSAA